MNVPLTITEEIARFNAERNAALLTGDINVVRAFRDKWNPNAPRSSNLEVELASMHKVITAVVALPIEYRRQSKQWLIAHGYRSDDDGDL
jgi:hypothetical protein